jgi:DNA-binding PadR family transcriptional regulator
MHHHDVSAPTFLEHMMLELAILGLLEDQALHGYEIRKRLREQLGFFSNVSFGSLYPALSRLERAGAVEAVEEPAIGSPVPMTGSITGERAAFRALRSTTARGRRARKVYQITEEGRGQFTRLLNGEGSPGDDARSFGLRLSFARHLAPHARLRLLERRRAQLLQDLADGRAAASSARLDSYAQSVRDHTTESTERDISWLDRLIDLEQSRGRDVMPMPAPAPTPASVPSTGTTSSTDASTTTGTTVASPGAAPKKASKTPREGETL